MTLRISLLGTFDVRSGTTALSDFRAQSARALLAYLALEPDRPHERTLLCHLLWPDAPMEQGLANLRQALHRLREALVLPGDEGALRITRHSVQLDTAAIWTDVGAISARLAATRRHSHRGLSSCPSCVTLLREAAELYRGDLLPGLSGAGGIQFEEWLLIWRERLHNQMAGVLDQLAAHHERRDEHRAAAEYLRRWLVIEPWSEPAHRRLIVTLALSGDRTGALRQFERCGAALATEIGAAPTLETQQIVAQIRAGRPPRAERTPGSDLRRAILAAEAATPFVGRGLELAAVIDRLLDPACRLLTLVGPGGSGKSRLALQAAVEAGYAFTDGAVFVALDAHGAGERPAAAIARALGLQAGVAQPPAEQLLGALQSRELLLLLDGCDHAPELAELLVPLIAGAPGVTVLATARAPLRLRAEWRIAVGGLGLAAADEDAGGAEAGQLFVAVARRLNADFTPGGDDWRMIGAICRLVGGLPLAIELAAWQLERTGLGEIAYALTQNSAELEAVLADVPQRHRSVRTVFDDSWTRLESRERGAQVRLSTVTTRFTAEEAESLCGRDAPLERLVEATPITRENGGYALPEPTRRLAARRAAGEEPAGQR